eukprot:6314329-Pyramimonas_sp.AAC.1
MVSRELWCTLSRLPGTALPVTLKTAVARVEPIRWEGGYYRDLLTSTTANPSACVSSSSILVPSQL